MGAKSFARVLRGWPDRMTKLDREIGSDLGQYVALALDHGVEEDMAALLEEVTRFRAATGH